MIIVPQQQLTLDQAVLPGQTIQLFPGGDLVIVDDQQLADPAFVSHAVAAPVLPTTGVTGKVSKAGPSHALLSAHAFTLATFEGAVKGDLSGVSRDALVNAEAVTPVGAHYLRQAVAATTQRELAEDEIFVA